MRVPTVTLNNGVELPQVGYGVYKVPSDETRQCVSTALEAGYRHLDTATLYDNERGVGEAVRDSGVTDAFVVTKLWNDDHGYDNALRAFDASLGRLGLEVLDLYLIHWPVPGRDLYVETWKALERLYADGRVRAIGVSNFEPDQLDRLVAECEVVPAVNQVELHPYLQQRATREANARLGIVTEAWSPLARGVDVFTDPSSRRWPASTAAPRRRWCCAGTSRPAPW